MAVAKEDNESTDDDMDDSKDDDDMDDSKDDDDMDDSKDDDDMDDESENLMSESEAINLALDKVAQYENLTVKKTDKEDDGWEIELKSDMYEIEVFVSVNGSVAIQKIEDESDDDMDDSKDDDDMDDDSDVMVVPTLKISDAVSQAQDILTGEIIRIQLKSSSNKLYWDIRTHLKERLEIDAGDGEVREFKSEVNGTKIAVKNKDGESEIKVKTDDGEIKAKGNQGFFARLFSIFG